MWEHALEVLGGVLAQDEAFAVLLHALYKVVSGHAVVWRDTAYTDKS